MQWRTNSWRGSRIAVAVDVGQWNEPVAVGSYRRRLYKWSWQGRWDDTWMALLDHNNLAEFPVISGSTEKEAIIVIRKEVARGETHDRLRTSLHKGWREVSASAISSRDTHYWFSICYFTQRYTLRFRACHFTQRFPMGGGLCGSAHVDRQRPWPIKGWHGGG